LKTPERIDLDLHQVNALLKRAKESLPPEDYEIIKAMADTIYLLSQSVDQKATSIRRLLRMLFGATTEKEDPDLDAGTRSKAQRHLYYRDALNDRRS